MSEHPLSPSPALLAKIGSVIVHASEALDEGGHEFDVAAFRSAMNDADVQEWLAQMNAMAMLPVRRAHKGER